MGSARNLKLRARIALVSGLLMCAFFIYFDITQPLGVAAGITYIAVVAVALVAQSKFLVVFFGGLGTLLTIFGFFASHPHSDVDHAIVLLNRGLSIFALLTISMTGYILIKRQEQFDSRLIELASTDPLTGLLNRRMLMAEAQRRTEEAERYQGSLSALMLDIDHFKRINDKHGHLAGDAILKAVAGVAKECARRTDYLGRYGGEEFLLVCPNTEREEAAIVAERIRAATEQLDSASLGVASKVTVSVGVAELQQSASVSELIDAADRALYRAKRGGRNRVVIEGGRRLSSAKPAAN